MKLSVIVPVYNVEQFLPRCLDSLLRQGLEVGEYEVICVNDGSPDHSAQILEEYQKKHPNIFHVITQENQGLGAARNTGMKAAQGEFIAFLDSDDYIIDRGYKYLLDHFCDEEMDVLQFSCVLIYTDGSTLYDPDVKLDGRITFEGDGAEAYNCQSLSYAWTKIYRRAFLEKHHILFEYKFLEDEAFNFEVFRHSPHFRIVTSPIYRYEQKTTYSLLTDATKEKVLEQLKDLLRGIDKMNRYLQEGDRKMEPAAKRSVNTYLRYYYNKMLKTHLTRQEWKWYTRQLQELPIHKVNTTYESSRLGKAIAHLKNWSGKSYVAYCIVELLMQEIFTKRIRPRIIASYSKES